MLRKLTVGCGIAGVTLFSFAALPTIPLTPQMVGTVLRDKTIYTVSGTKTLDASLMPGVSALRVPIGAEAVIWMEKGSKLVVNGGPGYGIIGGGAGIEVPCGAKLVIDGEGELVATGGSAASGGAGYGGREGIASAYISPTNLPDGLLPCQRDKIAPVGMRGGIWSTNVFSTPLMYGRAGCGGEGGEGGGGAGAGIGGRGGWGGAGGAGGLTRCVVPDEVYAKDRQRYLDCETYFSMSNTIPFHVCDQESRFYLTGPMGTSGNSGLRGGSGGDVVILGKVKVAATAGGAVSLQGGRGGSLGASRQYDHDQIAAPKNLKKGVTLGSKLVGEVGGVIMECSENEKLKSVVGKIGKVAKAAGVVTSVIDALGVFDIAKLKTLHYYAGGGGGGGGLQVPSAPSSGRVVVGRRQFA